MAEPSKAADGSRKPKADEATKSTHDKKKPLIQELDDPSSNHKKPLIQEMGEDRPPAKSTGDTKRPLIQEVGMQPKASQATGTATDKQSTVTSPPIQELGGFRVAAPPLHTTAVQGEYVVVTVELPHLTSAAQAELEVSARELVLGADDVVGRLVLPLPVEVDPANVR